MNNIGAEGTQHLASALQVNTVETWRCHVWLFLFDPYFTQTLTTLHLWMNNIGDEGAQNLASALQVNTVRFDCVMYDYSSSILISRRHSQRCIFGWMTSAMEEHSIWQVDCKWTQWDLTVSSMIIPLLSSFHKDTHNAGSSREQHRRWRSTVFGKCIASEHSEIWLRHLWLFLFDPYFTQTLTTLHLWINNIGDEGAQYLASGLQVNTVRLDGVIYDYSSSILISHRHSQCWIFEWTTSAPKEHSIWQVHCKWTQWDLTAVVSDYSSSILISHRHSRRWIF